MAEQDDDGHDDGTNNDGDQPPSYQQIFINWLFGPSNQSRPHSNSSESDNIDDDLSSDEGGDDWISKVYKDWKMVKIWPFSYLISLALYHLLSVIEFYINLFWKIASLFLFVYVYILANRLANVQNKQKECCCKCKQAGKAAE